MSSEIYTMHDGLTVCLSKQESSRSSMTLILYLVNMERVSPRIAMVCIFDVLRSPVPIGRPPVGLFSKHDRPYHSATVLNQDYWPHAANDNMAPRKILGSIRASNGGPLRQLEWRAHKARPEAIFLGAEQMPLALQSFLRSSNAISLILWR